ncbi:HTH-type transcriptional regulator SyrM 1 [compost metagenome]
MNPAFSSLTILQLRALVTILDVRNLSKAADILGTSQPAISRYLAHAREALGDPLVVRKGRQYVLTERGVEVIQPLKDILVRLEGMTSTINFSPEKCDRRFSIAGSDYVAQYILPDLMKDLALVAPKVSVDYRSWQANHYDWLANGEVDLAVSMVAETPADYHGRMIGEDHAVCCMRLGHPVSLAQSVDQEAYLKWPHVKITTGGDKDSFIDAYLRKSQHSRKLKLTVPYYSAALMVVQQSDALLTLPEHIACKWSEMGLVCYRPISFLQHQFRYWVVWHSRTQSSPEQQWFRHFIYQHCRASHFLSPGDRSPSLLGSDVSTI